MNWQTVQIGKTCFRTKVRDPRKAPNTPFLYVDISSIDRHLKVITSTPELLGSEAPSRARKEIRKGDVLVSTVRPNLNAVAMVPSELDGQIASTGFCILRPDPSLVEGKYLFYYTTTQDFIGVLNSKVRGAHYPAVSDGDVKRLDLPLPPLSEQKRIVEILEQAHALRTKRAEADDKAARILPALFYEMFGDPATNSKGWKYVELSDVIADTRNGLYKPSKFYGSGIGILKMFNIKDGELNLSRIDLIEVTKKEFEAYQLIPGDILINRVNTPELVGKCAIITDEVGKAVFESKNIRLRVKKDRVTSEYVVTYLNSPFGHASLRSGVKHAIGMATINNTDLRKTLVPLPPIELQQKWTNTVNHLRLLRKANVVTSKNLDLIYKNLLFKAFTGNLTAKWREAHMKELLAEMEEQAKELASPASVKDTSENISMKRHAGHDMFNKAALAAYITDRCHTPDRPIGRVKLAKLFYLVQKKAEIELTESFMKRAAGPLDDEIHKFLSLARKNKWVVLGRDQGDLKPVKPGTNVLTAVKQAEKIMGSAKAKVDEMLDQMKGWGYRALERWATVLDAAYELGAEGKQMTPHEIKKIIQGHPEWMKKLDQDEFSDANIDATLRGLRDFGFITEQ